MTASPPNQALHLTGAALLVSRDIKFLQRPRQVSLVDGADASRRLFARKETMSVILDIDLDYFGLFTQPVRELERLLAWAERPVEFVVRQHHDAYLQWGRMVKEATIRSPHLIIHVDEHHDMMSETPPVNFGSFIYFAMRQWPECRVHWVTPQAIDYPDMWLSAEAWDAISSRFSHVSRFRQQWPKPDLVSVCTSPGFIDERLSKRLAERMRDLGMIAPNTALHRTRQTAARR